MREVLAVVISLENFGVLDTGGRLRKVVAYECSTEYYTILVNLNLHTIEDYNHLWSSCPGIVFEYFEPFLVGINPHHAIP